MDRHARQARLVGAEGQRRIGRAVADVPLDGFAAVVAAGYLAGAGAGALRVRDASAAAAARGIAPHVPVEVEIGIDLESPAVPPEIRDPAAREAAAGALFALAVLRKALEEP